MVDFMKSIFTVAVPLIYLIITIYKSIFNDGIKELEIKKIRKSVKLIVKGILIVLMTSLLSLVGSLFLFLIISFNKSWSSDLIYGITAMIFLVLGIISFIAFVVKKGLINKHGVIILTNFKRNENREKEVDKKLENFIEKVAVYQEDTENFHNHLCEKYRDLPKINNTLKLTKNYNNMIFFSWLFLPFLSMTYDMALSMDSQNMPYFVYILILILGGCANFPIIYEDLKIRKGEKRITENMLKNSVNMTKKI